jgi:hypothetical protein
MKKMTENFKNFLFVIVLLCFASNIFATDSKPSLKIVNGEKKVLTLISNNANNTNVTIRIFDEQGIGLLKDDIAVDSKFTKSYDLSKLPKGTYEVEIEDDLSFRKYIVTTTSNTLEIIQNSEEKIFKPMIKLEKNIVLFNMLNLKSGEVELAFNNEQGDEIYFEKIQNMTTIHKSFDLSKLASGRYSISVKTKAKVFNLEVNLK